MYTIKVNINKGNGRVDSESIVVNSLDTVNTLLTGLDCVEISNNVLRGSIVYWSRLYSSYVFYNQS